MVPIVWLPDTDNDYLKSLLHRGGRNRVEIAEKGFEESIVLRVIRSAGGIQLHSIVNLRKETVIGHWLIRLFTILRW
jgi:hypothetical protein